MGFFDNLVGAVREANESAHGARLKRDLVITSNKMRSFSDNVRGEASWAFFLQANASDAECERWSREGYIKMANNYYGRARELQNFDMGKACGFALVGMYLESKVRKSVDAEGVFRELSGLLQELRAQVAAASAPPPPRPLADILDLAKPQIKAVRPERQQAPVQKDVLPITKRETPQYFKNGDTARIILSPLEFLVFGEISDFMPSGRFKKFIHQCSEPSLEIIGAYLVAACDASGLGREEARGILKNLIYNWFDLSIDVIDWFIDKVEEKSSMAGTVHSRAAEVGWGYIVQINDGFDGFDGFDVGCLLCGSGLQFEY